MILAIREAVFALACLACAGDGRRTQVHPQQLQVSSSAHRLQPVKGQARAPWGSAQFAGEHSLHRERAEQLQLLGELRGGATDNEVAGQPIIVRVMTRDGLKRVILTASAKLSELQRRLQRDHKFPVAEQRLSMAPGQQPFSSEADGERSLQELGIMHGALLYLEVGSIAPIDAPPSRNKSAVGAQKRAMTMTELIDERAAHEVELKMPPAAACSFLCVEPIAARTFANHMIDLDFEEKRVAFLYGRWAETADKEKRGVYVDVVYEPPQSCDAHRIRIDNDTDARAQLDRADTAARGLGLTLVGLAFAHPPRWHTMEVSELESIVRQRSVAASADPNASHLFVGMRFRAVYEGEPIEGEVTAEAYQPTEQVVDLIEKGALVDNAKEPGEAELVESSGLWEFKVAAENHSSADIAYFISRVHDLAKPYSPPAFGAFRTAFPVANRGDLPLRKYHLRTFLERERTAGLSFATAIADFQLLLHLSSIMPAGLFAKLCEALPASVSSKRTLQDEAAAVLREAESWVDEYAGIS